MSKKVIILGVSGSIGTNAIDVIRSHPEEFELTAIAALQSEEKCRALAREFGCRYYVGRDSQERAVGENDADVCLVASVGLSALKPTVMAIEKGMDIALATKEVMVMAGEIVMRLAKKYGCSILPVDSEHSAIFQCLPGGTVEGANVERLLLTASGGPFLDSPADLSRVTVDEALNHPRWKMGPKVTIDSSTMMNKGFEIIEAFHIFGVDVDRIDVVVHPESIVHSMVTFADGATLAQLSPPDMRVAIQYALSFPRRWRSERETLDLPRIGALTFREPDASRFPCLRLVKESCRRGGASNAVLAAADEFVVGKFLSREISYTAIARNLESAMNAAPNFAFESVDDVYGVANWVNEYLTENLIIS